MKSRKAKAAKNPQDFLDEVNRQPLNQEALRWLKVANANPDSTFGPYLFQLMLWALDQGKVELLPEYRSQVRSAVEQLTWGFKDPQKAMEYLVRDGGDPEDGFPLEVEDLSRHRSPVHVAEMLFNRLDMNMTADDNLEGVYPPLSGM